MPLSFQSASSFSSKLAMVCVDGSYGYIDTTGRMVIEPKFTIGWEFDGQVAIVGIKNMRVCINHTGEIITKRYERISRFSEGLAEVVRKGQSGFINEQGKLVIALGDYRSCQNFSQGLAAFFNSRNQVGYLNTKGEVAIECVLNGANPFSEDLAAVLPESNLWGYINREGSVVIPARYRTARSFAHGLAVVSGDLVNHSYIDHRGECVIPGPFRFAQPFGRDGLAIVGAQDNDGSRYGMIDKTGQIVIDLVYDNLQTYVEDRALACKGSTTGFIDRKGQWVIKSDTITHYQQAFSEGLAAVSVKNKFGYIDRHGNIVIDPVYDQVFPFSEGFAVVCRERQWGFINCCGESL